LYLIAVFNHADDEGLVLMFHDILDLWFRIDDLLFAIYDWRFM